MWDGLSGSDDMKIVVIGATNRPDDIDEAIKRYFLFLMFTLFYIYFYHLLRYAYQTDATKIFCRLA